MMRGAPAVVCSVGAMLGEGPCWSVADRMLWFVDIKRAQVHRFNPATDALESWAAPAQPGWILPVDDGTLMTGLDTGLHRFDPLGGTFDLIIEVEPDVPDNRLNDATVDQAGRLWFGSMDDKEAAPTGQVYRLDRGALARADIAPVTITNGPAFSPDGATLYHVDTLARTIHAFDVAPDGSLKGHRIFARIAPDDGYPDGPTVDSEGCLWIALFGGWGVRRYSPAGELLEFIRFPVANVTKVAFGGDDLRTAYTTTARKGLSPAALIEQPHAGDLFSFGVDVPGLAMTAISIGH
ncbi:SMP-30/gluconolactonase/LRE family protein [Sphingomonas cavernae]|uniref:SMP-30/gluconolactonase/LRE family protein n=1 Tax=Sphingomonas cavernae TaxID=2320861 RepID=A0A418WLC5_9SPHN|nr:SMP-30/gluconolactonase/LRE family protein [Sphingomonas cavernae]RJF90846.1 SMP-30/gluconolactonase/LRE family protein [Sphingomonas cavernae]